MSYQIPTPTHIGQSIILHKEPRFCDCKYKVQATWNGTYWAWNGDPYCQHGWHGETVGHEDVPDSPVPVPVRTDTDNFYDSIDAATGATERRERANAAKQRGKKKCCPV